jgi:WD40 repeat protein
LWALDFGSLPRAQSSLFRPLNGTSAHLLGLSGDFKYAAIPTQPDRVTVFDLQAGRAIAVLEVPGVLAPLSFPSGDPLVLQGYAAESDTVRRWQWKLDTSGSIPATQLRCVTAFQHPADAKHLAVVWLGEERGKLYETQAHDRSWPRADGRRIEAVHFSADRRTCAVCIHSGTKRHVELIDLETNKSSPLADEQLDAISNGGTLYAKLNDNSITVVDTHTGREICQTRHSSVLSLALSPDSRTFATGDLYGRVQLWNLATGNSIVEFETGADLGVDVYFSPDGRRLAALATYADEGHVEGLMYRAKLFIWSGVQDP